VREALAEAGHEADEGVERERALRTDRPECGAARYDRALGAFEETSKVQPQKIWEGVAGRVVHGERLTLGLVELDPASVVPEHSHENEQLGILISGSCEFRVGDEIRELGPGDTWSIPANTPHEVHTGPDGAVMIDVFAPVREDWKPLERFDREPLWP
jgi:quercetin dioxygenase-like cupin family protein